MFHQTLFPRVIKSLYYYVQCKVHVTIPCLYIMYTSVHNIHIYVYIVCVTFSPSIPLSPPSPFLSVFTSLSVRTMYACTCALITLYLGYTTLMSCKDSETECIFCRWFPFLQVLQLDFCYEWCELTPVIVFKKKTSPPLEQMVND